MKQPDNKKTVIKQKGTTDDIIKSVVSVYNESYQQAADFAQSFKGATIRNTAANIADFVVNNFNYKVDPEGEQWVRTPARLYADREADCKSFSIFVCSCLSCLGIKNGFRFVSYTPDKQITHVYSYAVDEDGNKFIIDTVAQIQKGLQPFEEIKYKSKKDVMNSYTKISKLSGVPATEEEIRTLTTADSAATIFVKSLIFKSRVLKERQTANKLESLLFICQTYGNDPRKYEIACYAWIGIFLGNDISVDSQIKMIETAVTEIGKNPAYTIDANFVQTVDYINVNRWLQEYVTPYITVYYPTDPNVTVEILNENAFNFLYLFVDNKYLSKAQRKKKVNEFRYLQMIIANTAINEAAALNLVYCFSTMNFGAAPQNVLAKMFKTIPANTAEIGEIQDPDGILNPDGTVKDTTSSSDKTGTNIMTWIDKAVDSFVKIFGTVKGSNSVNNGITPYYTDVNTSSGVSNILLFGLLLGGGFMILKDKKNNKKRK